jgi:hypothetical protein
MNPDASAARLNIWRKSSYSTSTGNCVEIARTAWRKSSYSTGTGNCVEIRIVEGVAVRHSKHPSAGTITFPLDAWAAFVREARSGIAEANDVATIVKIGTDTFVRSLDSDVELRFDVGEWSAFLAGAADGEFDFTGELAAT